MTENTKRIGLIFLVGALVSLILLAGSLSNVQLQKGTPFPGVGNLNDTNQSPSNISRNETVSIPIVRGIFALFFLILAIYVPTRLMEYINIKKLVQFLLVMIVLLGLITLLPSIKPSESSIVTDNSIAQPTVAIESYPISPLGQPPKEFIRIVLVVVGLGIGLLAFKILKQSNKSTGVEAHLLQEAEDAVNALLSGKDLRNVIIRCYLQMTFSLQEEQGIERNEHLTVREFEDWLQHKGFPVDPVHQLTSLFEKVRYSKQPTSKDDEKMAMDCLNEIIRFCQQRSD